MLSVAVAEAETDVLSPIMESEGQLKVQNTMKMLRWAGMTQRQVDMTRKQAEIGTMYLPEAWPTAGWAGGDRKTVRAYSYAVM